MTNTDDSLGPLQQSDFPFIDGAEEDLHANGDDRNKIQNPPCNAPMRSMDFMLNLTGNYAFKYLLASSIVQLCIYLNKLYEDSSAVGRYWNNWDIKCTLISSCSLFAPALVYICYVVSVYIKDHETTDSKEVGTRVVHGFLLVPWQIKGRVEFLQFSAQRICQQRSLTETELKDKGILERNAAVLEFFEEFYAGITQLLLQLYIIIQTLDGHSDNETLSSEIIASVLTLMAMLVAVRRKDDGILTSALSMLGWTCIFISRSLCIALTATVLYSWMVLLLFLHAAGISCWVYAIALASYYRDSPSIDFSTKRKFALYVLIFTVFGLPAITYWPIMFDLKKRKRPFGFLCILFLENVLFVGLWIVFKENPEWQRHCYVLVFMITGFYIAGFVFVMMYIWCKPKYIDQVVYHDMKASNADIFGIYFEFCDMTFKLKREKKVEERLKEVREQRRNHP